MQSSLGFKRDKFPAENEPLSSDASASTTLRRPLLSVFRGARAA